LNGYAECSLSSAKIENNIKKWRFAEKKCAFSISRVRNLICPGCAETGKRA
jgi:hypothetical protein